MPDVEKIFDYLLHASPEEDVRQAAEKCKEFIHYLEGKNDILFLTTSTRYIVHKDDIPESTQLAKRIQAHFNDKRITIIDVAKLMIHTCEGNISAKRGNRCGMMEAILEDKEKNPSGYHRCWASINNEDDELYKITQVLFNSKVVVFFASI